MMWKYNCKKRNQYYDSAIRLYIHEKMGGRKISRIIPVSESIISRWIRNFTAETKGQVVMKSKSSIKSASSATGTKDSEVKALQAEIRRLKKDLAHESLRADAFNELINVAEKQFNISIRKKLAPSSKEPACRRLRTLPSVESLHTAWRDEAGLLQV